MNHEVSTCEREPVHLLNSIQPFGLLLTVDTHSRRIVQTSRNVREFLGVEPSAVVGRTLDELLLDRAGQPLDLREVSHPLPCRAGVRDYLCFLHASMNHTVLEIEPVEKDDCENFYGRAVAGIARVQDAGSIRDLCQAAAEEVARLTGYDRVMVYRFDQDWNGKVVAESLRRADVESYMGHHFPASDIPPQARAIFEKNWLRMIPAVDYAPATLEPERLGGQVLDLGRSFLRGVSPIHLRYLRNMGVQATMTISLKSEGRLWGIIACHHETPWKPTITVRDSCRFIGRLLSSLLHLKEETEDGAYKAHLRSVFDKLVSRMEQSDDLVQGLVEGSPNLLDLTGAGGAAAAVYFEDEWTLIGRTPTVEQITGLVAWLDQARGSEDIYHTECLGELYPEADAFKDVASGLLAIAIPKSARNFVLWFKPEVLQTVVWAGNPSKAVERLADGTLKIEPRASFEAWRETVKNHSLPWRRPEIEAARELRVAIIGLDLKRQFEREQQARRQKEDLLHAVSHDLKSPLQALSLASELLDRRTQSMNDLAPLVAGLRRPLRHMKQLVHDLLDVSQIEAGQFRVEAKCVSVIHLLEETRGLFEALAEERSVSLLVEPPDESCQAECDETRVLQVLSNLVGNAIKFTPAGGRITMGIVRCEDDVCFSVVDDGPGIDREHLPHIFDRFYQVRNTGRAGSGLGLAIAKGVVEAHRGRIWIESEPGRGTRVFFTLPGGSKS